MSELSAYDFDRLFGRDMTTVFETLENIGVISSPGTGAILYDRRYEVVEDFTRNLKTAAVASSLRLTGLDRVRQLYVDGNDNDSKPDPLQEKYAEAYWTSMRHVEDALEALQPTDDATPTYGAFAGSIALQRLRYSFVAAHVLYQLRLKYEADAVARHILEQTAWAVAVAPLDDERAIKNVQAQKVIGKLRALTDLPHAGQLFSELSASAHAGIDEHRAVYFVDENQRGVVKHGVTDWVASAAMIMSIADLWVIALEVTQGPHMSRHVSTDAEQGFVVRDDREFLAHTRQLIREMVNMEPNQFGDG